jgi:hypothetical protein
MEKAQLTVLMTGVSVVLAGLAEETPAPVMVNAEAMLARAALSAVDTDAPLEAVAETNERVTREVSLRSRSRKVIEPLSRS